MSDWTNLSESGYWVFPTKARQKFPSPLGGQAWDVFIKEGDRALLHAHLLHEKGVTGAALCPQPDDPTRLLILDLDVYSMEFDALWPSICPRNPPDPALFVVGSPSGGFHIWFRLPDEVDAERLPATFDFGDGVTGEVRVSSRARRLIMLPGSLATNKNGKPAKYSVLQGDPDPACLPTPPPDLMARLVARRDQGKAGPPTGSQPTEVGHFLSLLSRIEDISEGERNVTVAQVGQIIGRLHPSAKITPKIIAEAWDALCPLLGHNFGEAEFRVAINSGWSTGSQNAEKYQSKEKHPSVSDIKAECEGIFSGVPWMVEIRDSTGKTKEWMLGFGGSAKRRHEATKITRLRDLRDILPTLTRLASASLDTVARSPLFIQAGWARVLEYMLSTEKAVDQLGIPPEERFWELLEEWSRIAAGDLLFLEAWTERRPLGTATAFIVWPLTEGQAPTLVMPLLLQETLLTQLGDIPKAKKLVKKYLLQKTLVGMRSGQKVWACPIHQLQTETQEYIGAQYEQFVQRKGTDE